jgi:hypothetical protein
MNENYSHPKRLGGGRHDVAERAYSASSQAIASFTMTSSSCIGRPAANLESVAGSRSRMDSGIGSSFVSMPSSAS